MKMNRRGIGLAVGLTVGFMVLLLSGCKGTPEESAKWYFKDKPKDERVPVTDQTDPGAAVTPDPNEK